MGLPRGDGPGPTGYAQDDPSLGTADLTERELADALWLAAVRVAAGQRPASREAGTGSRRSAPRPVECGNGDSPARGDTMPGKPPLEKVRTDDGRSPGDISSPGHPDYAEGRPETDGMDAIPVRWEWLPAADRGQLSPLADRAGITRSLRSFKRVVASRWKVELDEEATAEHAAEDGLWLPYTRPAATRWLDLVLIVDDGPSMSIWRPTITDFATTLERLGAFRDIRQYVLDLHPNDIPASAPRVVLRGKAAGSGYNDPAELVTPPGARVILVVTDGLGPAWRTGAAQRALALWGRSASLAVIHLLPQQSWHRTAVIPRRVRLRAPSPAAPNRQFAVKIPEAWRGAFDPAKPDHQLAVPVLELNREWLMWWAGLVTGASSGWCDASVLLVGSGTATAADSGGFSPPQRDTPPPIAASGRERVLNFRASASPTAVRLATHLAAAPLEPRFIRLVQRVMVPESRPVHLAEIMLSGLIRPYGDQLPSGSPPPVPLDFIDGAREAFLAGAGRVDTARVLAAASDHFGDRVPAARALKGVLLAPDGVPDPPVTPQSLPFVGVEFAVMRALSGPYLGRARRIGHAIADLRNSMATPEAVPDPKDTTETNERRHYDRRSDTAPGAASPFTIHDNPDEIGAHMQEGSAQHLAPGTREADTATPTIDVERVASTPEFSQPASASGDPGGGTSQVARGYYRGQRAVPSVWGNVPPMNPNFTGREELLADLHGQLQVNTTAAVLPHTLHGMGGVGKSQIAIEYVYRHAHEYEVIWWIPAEQPGQILTSLATLAQSLGLDVGSEANIAVPAVTEALRSGRPYRNWLIVFDNAEDVGTIRSFFPTGGPGKVLVTSRNPEWDRVAHTLSVDVFTREESKELLRRRTPDLSDIEADQLAEALGDLPLAIEQAAAWRAATGMAAGEYLQLIEEKRTELLDVAPSPDYPLSVAAAWNVSLDRLTEGNKAALQLLQICAFFAPEPISRNLFRASRDMTLPPELDEALRDPIKLGRAIRDIHRYALARIEHRSDTIQLHRLVQAVLIGRMPPQVQDEMRHGAHVLLAAANPNSPGSADQWPRYQALLPHVTVSKVIDCDDSWVRQLLVGIVEFLYFWGDHEGCRDLARNVVSAWTTRFGEDDGQTLAVARWLAFILRVLGNYDEAALLHERLLESYLRTAGEDDEGTLAVMSQMAADMRVRGDFAGARERDELVFERSRRVFGEDDPATLFAAHNLAVSLRLVGDYQAALRLDEDTWQRRAVVLGEDSAATLSTLNGLAIDQRECGDYLAARIRQEETFRRTVERFGVSNPATILAARNLAVCRRRAGDHEGARTISEDALSRFQRRYGDSYPDTLATATNLAVDLRQTGDLEGSLKLGETTFGRYARTLGERHPYTLSVRVNLAVTLRLLGELDAAYQHNEATLAAFRETLGEENVLTLICATNLGSDLFAREDFAAALQQDTDTLARLRRVLGEDHPTTLACALNLTLDLRATGKVRQGDTLHIDTVGRLRAVLGRSHPATGAAVRGNRAECDIAPMPM
jgi:tetratricopeptide (TPR) repeat protein